MAVDIRAIVTCSLGTLIGGSISDEYLQGSGLLRTRGSVEISGTITPAIGTVVTLSYLKGGVTRTIPRKLRVLSSFADPFRRTTRVELGCKLAYLSDLKDAIDWSVYDDPENATAFGPEDSRIVTLPIRASSVMSKCLTELGITASSSPLTNSFSVGSFDFGPGYVQVLSDLLVSESYFGYLDASEVLQIINLADDSGTGPSYTQSDIIDLAPINSGQLPGEAVTVSYSSLKLKQPDPDSDADSLNWERVKVVSTGNYYAVGRKIYKGNEVSETVTKYIRVNDKDLPYQRTTTERARLAKVAGSFGSAFEEFGISLPTDTAEIRSETENIYYSESGEIVRRVVSVRENALAFFGALSLPWAFSASDYVTPPSGMVNSSRTETTYRQSDSSQLEVSTNYIAWIFTLPGQQAIAEARETFTSAADVGQFIASVFSGDLVQDRTVANITTRNTVQGRPESTLNASLARDGGDPGNGYRTDNAASLELAVGSASAQRRIELSMPYAPDDYFTKVGSVFTAQPSDAGAKANRFGRVQNRLLLGNRNGMNLQLAPERLPAAPFAPMYVQANGLTAQYRANGNQWAFDSNGIVCSTDALFWAAVGGTGTFWFPVAPGVATLPATPPIVDGTITPTQLTLPYNETARYEAVVRTTLSVRSLNYALQIQTAVPALVVRTQLTAARVRLIEVPAAITTIVAAQLPKISTGASVSAPTARVVIAAQLPSVASGASVPVPPVGVIVTALAPTQAGPPKTLVNVPVGVVRVAAPTPTVVSGASVAVPAAATVVRALAPSVVTTLLLLEMEGANGSTTFVDSSSSARSVSASGGAAISTARSKFGTGSLLLSTSGDYLTVSPPVLVSAGTPLTLDAWIYRTDSCVGTAIIAEEYTGSGDTVAYALGFEEGSHVPFVGTYDGSGWIKSIGSADVALNTWVNLRGVYNGSTWQLFVDDVAQTASGSVTVPNDADAMFIGRRWDQGGTNVFIGNIDRVRVS